MKLESKFFRQFVHFRQFCFNCKIYQNIIIWHVFKMVINSDLFSLFTLTNTREDQSSIVTNSQQHYLLLLEPINCF